MFCSLILSSAIFPSHFLCADHRSGTPTTIGREHNSDPATPNQCLYCSYSPFVMSSPSPSVNESESQSPAAAVTAGAVTDVDLALIDSLITTHADFPIPGIQFKDIFPVFRNTKVRSLLYRHTDNHSVSDPPRNGTVG